MPVKVQLLFLRLWFLLSSERLPKKCVMRVYWYFEPLIRKLSTNKTNVDKFY